MVQAIVKPQRLQQVNQVAGVGTRTQPKQRNPTSVGFFLSPCAMENNLIQIEKGKYTALLRRILGMQMSENGVPEMQAILTKMGNLADGARHAYEYGGTIDEIEDNIESIEFAIEYYHLRKDDLRAPLIKEAGKIDLRKNVVERDCDDCK